MNAVERFRFNEISGQALLGLMADDVVVKRRDQRLLEGSITGLTVDGGRNGKFRLQMEGACAWIDFVDVEKIILPLGNRAVH